MSEKYLKKSSTSVVVKEMQTNTIVRFCLTRFRKLSHVTAHAGQDKKLRKNSSIDCGIANLYRNYGNMYGDSLKSQ